MVVIEIFMNDQKPFKVIGFEAGKLVDKIIVWDCKALDDKTRELKHEFTPNSGERSEYEFTPEKD